VPLYARVARESDARLAALAAAPPGATVVADSFAQVEESWWFIGDDFRVAKKRELVADYLGLARVRFRDGVADVPLGVGGARIVARAWTAGAACPLDEPLDLDGLKPFDLAGIHASIRRTVDGLARRGVDTTGGTPGVLARLAARGRFAPRPAGASEPRGEQVPLGGEAGVVPTPHDSASLIAKLEVVVELPGAGLPRDRLVLARWDGQHLLRHEAAIARQGTGTTREVVPTAELAATGLDLYVAQIGSGARRLGTTADRGLRYVPWRTGTYWVLACDAAECWIVAAARNHAL
jgi:hypothetical protein